MSVTVDAMETLKKIGELYGLYSPCEEMRDRRVMYEETPTPALVIQEDISYHGSPCWETKSTLTTDPDRIKQYCAFGDLLDYIKQSEREPERKPMPPSAYQKNLNQQKKGKATYER